MPIRDDHSLDPEINDKLVSRVSRTTVDLMPTGENADNYSILWTSWSRLICWDKVLEVVDDIFVPEREGESTPASFAHLRVCQLCKKWDITHFAFSLGAFRKHMRTR